MKNNVYYSSRKPYLFMVHIATSYYMMYNYIHKRCARKANGSPQFILSLQKSNSTLVGAVAFLMSKSIY